MVTQKYVYQSDEEYPVYYFVPVTVQVADDEPVLDLPVALVEALDAVRTAQSNIMIAISQHLESTGQRALRP